ncbi:MAG: hypothetical protein JXR32_01745, partial [Anaerolineaceae bacterium]|nr:hypothetical protein [Anaerolineaceae bacterium]
MLAGRQPADLGVCGVVANADAEVIDPAAAVPPGFVPTKLPLIVLCEHQPAEIPTLLPLTTLPCP